MIEKHIIEELPFMATENILMDAVKKGGDRQELHEGIRKHAMDAAYQVKACGQKNDLISCIAADPVFQMTEEEITGRLAPENYTGFAARQTEVFLAEHVEHIIRENEDNLVRESELYI